MLAELALPKPVALVYIWRTNRLEAATRRLDETNETQRLMEDLKDINDRVMCLRTPGGMSKRVRLDDHRP